MPWLAISSQVTAHNISYNINSNNLNKRIANNPILICQFKFLNECWFLFDFPKKSELLRILSRNQNKGVMNNIRYTHTRPVCLWTHHKSRTHSDRPFPFIMWWKFVNKTSVKKCPIWSSVGWYGYGFS
jgi:hypothetical protein